MGTLSKRQKIAFTVGILVFAVLALAAGHEWKLQSARRAPKAHAVQLTWGASPSAKTTGYNVYRSYASGVGYVRLNSSPVKECMYVDSTISEGHTYYYAITAVDDSGNESNWSKEIRIEVP